MTPAGRILVVDDERSMREFLEIFLRSEGYDVAAAGDVARAAGPLEADDFDVVITDVQMPGGVGPRPAARGAGGRAATTVVVVMTAFATHRDARSRR